MIYTLKDEQEIIARCRMFKDDPYGFVHWVYPWGVPGTPLANMEGPRRWQIEELLQLGEAIKNSHQKRALEIPLELYKAAWSSGRGPGKSGLFGMLAHWMVSCHFGASVQLSANTENQMRNTTFPEFAKWFNMAINRHWFRVDGMAISIQPWLADEVALPVEQGGMALDTSMWGVFGKTWTEDNPSAYVGLHNMNGFMLLFDEGSGIHSSIWERAEGFFTELSPYHFHFAASQMRNRQGRFYEIFYEKGTAEKPGLGWGWRSRTLSTRGMDGMTPDAHALVEDQIKRYGIDSDFVRVEIMGLPPRTSEDQFIPWDCVKAAQENDLIRDWGEPLILGVDPAPRGKTAWRFRQGRNARDCCGEVGKGGKTYGSWLGYDNVQIADAILELDRTYKPDDICIDFGMGTGVIDILKRKRTNGRLHEVKFGGAAPKDSEFATNAIKLWADVRDWLPGGMVEKDDGLKGTLSHQLTDRGWRWSGKEDNKKILETKEDMASRGVKSPDDADALACTFEVNPPRRAMNGERAGKVLIAQGTDPGMFD